MFRWPKSSKQKTTLILFFRSRSPSDDAKTRRKAESQLNQIEEAYRTFQVHRVFQKIENEKCIDLSEEL